MSRNRRGIFLGGANFANYPYGYYGIGAYGAYGGYGTSGAGTDQDDEKNISQSEQAHQDFDNSVEGNDIEDGGAFGELGGGDAGASLG